jgi:hypothetical protein
MNHDYEKQLEARIHRELKGLGELRAPETIVPRIMRAVGKRGVLPWYRRSWQTWPVALRAASLTLLLGMFCGLCFAAWALSNGVAGTAFTRNVTGDFVTVGVFWRTLGVLGNAVVLLVRHLGTGFIVGSAAVLLVAYAACVGLGTTCFRMAMVRR